MLTPAAKRKFVTTMLDATSHHAAKEFAVDCRDLLPILYPGEQNPGTSHIRKLTAQCFKGGPNHFQTSSRLTGRIAFGDDAAIFAERGCASGRNELSWPRFAPLAKCQLLGRKAILSRQVDDGCPRCSLLEAPTSYRAAQWIAGPTGCR